MKRHILLLCLLGNPYELIHGGHQRTIHEIIEYFKNYDTLTFTIITSNTNSSDVHFQQLYSNMHYYEIGIPTFWVEEQDQLYLNRRYLLTQIDKICQKLNTPLSLLHTTYWISGIIGTKISKKYHIPQIHSPISSSFEKICNGFVPRTQYQRGAEEIIYKNASLILSITKAEFDILCNEYHVEPEKIQIIGRAVEPCFKNPAHFSSGNLALDSRLSLLKERANFQHYNDWWVQNAFCYVGRIVDYKGIKEIIQAWDILYKKYESLTPPLWILGGNCDNISSYRPEILKLVPDLPLYESEQKICWWGYLTSEGISNILLKCSALIVHSGFEPGGRVVLEALAMGKPIISTPFGFAKDYVFDWYNGFQVAYQDIAHLASCMELFIKNPYLTNMLGMNSRDMYLELEQSWEHFNKMEQIYSYYGSKAFIKVHNMTHPKESDKKTDFIDVFPYCDIKNSVTNIEHEFSVSKAQLTIISTPYSYLWKVDNVIIKQYFNRINYQQLWNPHDNQKVICLTDLYRAAIYSAQFNSILSICKKSDILFTYTMPQATKLSPEECLLHMPRVLKNFQEETSSKLKTLENLITLDFASMNKGIQNQYKHYTIRLILDDLLQAIKINTNSFTQEEKTIIFKIIAELGKSDINHTLGLNYGKSLINHMVIWNSEIFLLPSGEVYWGEIGFDAAISYVEYHGEAKIVKLLHSIAWEPNIIAWICCLLTERYVQSKILLRKVAIDINCIMTIIKERL